MNNDVLSDILEAGAVRRFHAMPKLPSQTIGEHSWRIAMIGMHLWPDEMDEAFYREALLHDAHELRLGDVPSSAKPDIPNFKEAELRIARQWRFDHNLPDVLLHPLVWLADKIDLLIYLVEHDYDGRLCDLVRSRIEQWLLDDDNVPHLKRVYSSANFRRLLDHYRILGQPTTGDGDSDHSPEHSDSLAGVAKLIDEDRALGIAKEREYGPSWKKRGGVGAFHMLARKWDRIEGTMKLLGWDVFSEDADIDDELRDFRIYSRLVEAEADGVTLDSLGAFDYSHLREKQRQYGHAWKRRGGEGAFMITARKWDAYSKQCGGDAFCFDFDVSGSLGDLRRFMYLIEAERREQHGKG